MKGLVNKFILTNSNLTVISDGLNVVGTTLTTPTPAQGDVANGGVVTELPLGAGTWIVSGYSGGVKTSLETAGLTVQRMGTNPFVVTAVTTGTITIRLINRSGNTITRYADGANYYIIATRIK